MVFHALQSCLKISMHSCDLDRHCNRDGCGGGATLFDQTLHWREMPPPCHPCPLIHKPTETLRVKSSLLFSYIRVLSTSLLSFCMLKKNSLFLFNQYAHLKNNLNNACEFNGCRWYNEMGDSFSWIYQIFFKYSFTRRDLNNFSKLLWITFLPLFGNIWKGVSPLWRRRKQVFAVGEVLQPQKVALF